MRDCLNYNMLPIEQVNCISLTTNGTITNIPSNGYYGYQPPPMINDGNKMDKIVNHEQMDVVMQLDEYDNRRRFENVNNRKRTWEMISGDIREFKKRRQNHDINHYDTSPTQQSTSITTTTTGSSTKEVVWLRKPTHNLPDMPRCMMGHYI